MNNLFLEQENFMKIIESIDVLVENEIIKEDNILIRAKDALVNSAKQIWHSIINVLDKIAELVNVKFKKILEKKVNDAKVEYGNIVGKSRTNTAIYNALNQRVDAKLYAICINDRETYLHNLTREDQEKYSAKNAFTVIYEMYAAVPKAIKTPDKYTDELNKSWDHFYEQLEKVFGSKNNFKITVKKYESDLGDNSNTPDVSISEEFSILGNRLDSTVDTMNDLITPYKIILKDKIAYNTLLDQIISNQFFAIGSKYEAFKTVSNSILKDYSFYNTMVHLYAKVFFGYIRETFNNLTVYNSLLKRVNIKEEALPEDDTDISSRIDPLRAKSRGDKSSYTSVNKPRLAQA